MDKRTRERAEALLLGAGQLHGIAASKEEIKAALDDAQHGPAFAEWAILHLGQANLLTADEMALYTALDNSGQVDELAEQHDLADVQAVTGDEIRAAVEEINRSTAAIIKQTETLKLQQDALSRLMEKAGNAESRRRDFELARQHNAGTERKFVSAQVEDLSQSLGFRLADLAQQDAESGTNLSQIIDGVLGSDDKLLASLQKLGYELDQQDPDEAKTIDRLRETCLRLIKTTVQTIRTRLDRLYLESLVAAEHSGDANPTTTEDEVKAMEEEVESLYSEILPVAQMSVEQQYLEPALQSNSTRDGRNLNRSAMALRYINACLNHLLDRCENLKTTIETLKSHQAASASVVTAAKAALVAPTEAPARRQQKLADLGSPVRRPRTNTGRTRGARRSSGVIDESALDTLLQNLAVYLPAETEEDGGRKIRALAGVVSERATKGEDMARGAQESFEAAAMEYLDDVQRAVQMLKDSLMAESPYGRVQLEDADIRGSLDALANEVGKVKDGLQRAEASKVAKSQKKDEIIQRWGA